MASASNEHGNMSIPHKIALLALLLASACAHAQVFECVDANGKKSFSEKCPADAVKAKEMHPQVGDPGNPVTSKDKIKSLDATYTKQRVKANEKAADENDKADDARANAQACADAKARLETLQSGKQYKRVDPVTGEHVPMDDATRQSQIDSLNREIADACR